MKTTLSILFGLAALPSLGQEAAPSLAADPIRKFSVGVLGTYNGLGIQSDYRFTQRWGVKLAGVHQFGYERAAEYSRAGIGLLTYSLPTNFKLVEPVVGVGAVYTNYHWALAGGSGDVNDLNFGVGFGTNLRFTDRFRTGLNIFVVNGFRAEYQAGDMKIIDRQVRVFPALTLDFIL
jgi:hypothetical protein